MNTQTDKARSQVFEVLNFHFEAPYFQALYNAPVPVTVAREDGRLLLVNRAFQEATGFPAEALPTIDAWIKLQNDREADEKRRFDCHFDLEKTPTPVQVTVRNRSGQRLVWEISNAPLGRTPDGYRMTISIASDVTRKVDDQRHLERLADQLEQEACNRAEALNATIEALENEIEERIRTSDALKLSRERLKKLSMRTLAILEADRRTISKELHDSLGASLAAIKFSLEDKELKRVKGEGRLAESLEREIAHLQATIKETKRISANLRPTTLDDLGLMATIEWYLRQFRRVYHNMAVEYKADITEEDVPDPIKIVIYRIIQEGLANAEKHSEAGGGRLRMEFADEKRSISLFIQDDGRGFDVQEALSQKDPLSGYGLIAMRERCEILGGSFHLDSRIGKGTPIIVTLPV